MNNLEIIKAYQEEVWVQKKISAIDKYFDKDALIHSAIGLTKSLEKMKTVLSQWLNSFPDLFVVWDEFIVEDQKVVSRWHATGTHLAEFIGYPATNQKIHYAGVTIYELSNEKISQYWAFVDMQSIIEQITHQTTIVNDLASTNY